MIAKVRMTITAPQNVAKPRPKYSFLSFKNIFFYIIFFHIILPQKIILTTFQKESLPIFYK